MFLEDINDAADGGLYAEMVQNRSFEFSLAHEAWTLRKGGLEADAMMQTIGGMNPTNGQYLRFPGGCMVQGRAIAGAYRRKDTIGDVEGRQAADNFWGYHQSFGLGFAEYFRLAEAAYVTGLERNGDVVMMASSAPLLAKEGATQWEPDLIRFNNETTHGIPSYYVLRLSSHNLTKATLPLEVRAPGRSETSFAHAGRAEDGSIVIKIVNVESVPRTVRIALSDARPLNPVAQAEVLSHRGATAENSFRAPENVVPRASVLTTASSDFLLPLEANSVTVLRLHPTAPRTRTFHHEYHHSTRTSDRAACRSSRQLPRRLVLLHRLGARIRPPGVATGPDDCGSRPSRAGHPLASPRVGTTVMAHLGA